MKSIIEVIKEEIKSFTDENLKKFFRNNFLELFEALTLYVKTRVDVIEERSYETMNELSYEHEICMTLMNEDEFRLYDDVFSPVYLEDLLDKKMKSIDFKKIIEKDNMLVQTIYIDLSKSEEQELLSRKFDGYIDIYSKKIPLEFRLKKSTKYNDIIKKLYNIFLCNKIKWKTVNSFYNDNFYDIEIITDNIKDFAGEEVYELHYDLSEFEKKAEKDYFLVWNINIIESESTYYPLPYEDEILYRYKLDYFKNKPLLVNSKNSGNMFSVYMEKYGSINVLSNNRMEEKWEIWEFINFNDLRYKEDLKFKVYSNTQSKGNTDGLNREFNHRIRTKAELNKLLKSYLDIKNISIHKIEAGSLKTTKYLELKKLNEFIKYEFDLNEDLKQDVTIKLDFENIDEKELCGIMSFISSELEYIYPEYRFKVVDPYVNYKK